MQKVPAAMKPLLFLPFALLTTLTAQADVVIEQKVESAMLNGSMVFKIGPTKHGWICPAPADR